MEIAAIGPGEFTLGFELVGIKTFNIEKAQEIKRLTKNEFGVIIIDDKTMGKLEDYERKELEDSIKPLFIVLSTENSEENINKLIKRSIGIDL
ncbi:V-type ATP synthase subunit F [Candidatus Woesearchaeota archaeon]|nr:V-type ATP synthase subunit F [Candidatus Woesearchaeota archaeon]